WKSSRAPRCEARFRGYSSFPPLVGPTGAQGPHSVRSLRSLYWEAPHRATTKRARQVEKPVRRRPISRCSDCAIQPSNAATHGCSDVEGPTTQCVDPATRIASGWPCLPIHDVKQRPPPLKLRRVNSFSFPGTFPARVSSHSSLSLSFSLRLHSFSP